MQYYGVGDVSARLGGVPRRVLSDGFYTGLLDAARCPLVSGRRLIPEDYLPELEETLRRVGKLPEPAVVSA
jgi:hypothetical protein